jgi:hypothetical protein
MLKHLVNCFFSSFLHFVPFTPFQGRVMGSVYGFKNISKPKPYFTSAISKLYLEKIYE